VKCSVYESDICKWEFVKIDVNYRYSQDTHSRLRGERIRKFHKFCVATNDEKRLHIKLSTETSIGGGYTEIMEHIMRIDNSERYPAKGKSLCYFVVVVIRF
jgi:hypothetical protein